MALSKPSPAFLAAHASGCRHSLACADLVPDAVLYTCDLTTCLQQAHVLKRDLAAIGLQVHVNAFPVDTMFARIASPGEPFDVAFFGWHANYPDPIEMLTRCA